MRGFDHCYLVACKLAEIRGWKVEKILSRKKDSVQVGADRNKRLIQASKAYDVTGNVAVDKKYLLLDDIVTTGASIKNAENLLRKNGAVVVYKVVIAKEV